MKFSSDENKLFLGAFGIVSPYKFRKGRWIKYGKDISVDSTYGGFGYDLAIFEEGNGLLVSEPFFGIAGGIGKIYEFEYAEESLETLVNNLNPSLIARVYPNPIVSELNILIESSVDQWVRLSFYDLNGRCCMNKFCLEF